MDISSLRLLAKEKIEGCVQEDQEPGSLEFQSQQPSSKLMGHLHYVCFANGVRFRPPRVMKQGN